MRRYYARMATGFYFVLFALAETLSPYKLRPEWTVIVCSVVTVVVALLVYRAVMGPGAGGVRGWRKSKAACDGATVATVLTALISAAICDYVRLPQLATLALGAAYFAVDMIVGVGLERGEGPTHLV